MDQLSFIAKIIGVTARPSAAVALAALLLYLGRRAGIEFFVTLNPEIFHVMIVAGIVGACGAVLKICRGAWLFLEAWLPGRIERRRSRRAVLRNMEALPREHADVLRFLRSNDLRRFRATTQSSLLREMHEAYMLEIDDPNLSARSANTCYVVPGYLWNKIDKHLSNHPVPDREPWTALPNPQTWMR